MTKLTVKTPRLNSVLALTSISTVAHTSTLTSSAQKALQLMKTGVPTSAFVIASKTLNA